MTLQPLKNVIDSAARDSHLSTRAPSPVDSETAYVDHNNPVTGCIDQAYIQRGAGDQQYLYISGWIYYIAERPVILQLGAPGSPFVIAHRLRRDDVAARFAAYSGIAESGFEARLPLGPHTSLSTLSEVYFLATLSDGLALSGCFPLPSFQHKSDVEPSTQVTTKSNSLVQAQKTILQAFLASGERLSFSPQEEPLVSIIIPLHNKAELTLGCLQALAAAEAKEFQVVLVDNASADETDELLQRVDGVKTIRLPTNLHFIEACNRGAQAADGRNLLFLNNDTMVTASSIKAALRCLSEEPNCGAVGGRLIRFDGRLQEAGSIIWNDASTCGYGADDDPWQSSYAFRRDVDYCSGAFLLTPTKLFYEAGKFSSDYAPAYYEDADYCLRLRKLGYRVLYEPGAVVLHAEHGSSSATEAVALQKTNRNKFAAAHQDYLLQRPSPDSKHLLWGRSAPSNKPRILYIEDRIPSPGMGSGFPRSLQLIESLAEFGSEVTLFPTIPSEETWGEIYQLLPHNVEVITNYTVEQLDEFLDGRSGFYDFIVISRPHNMERFTAIWPEQRRRHPNTKLIYDAEAIYAVRDILKLMVEKELMLPPEDIRKIVSTEVNLAEHADCVLTVSETEAEYFKSLPNCRVEVVSYGATPAPGMLPFEARKHFLTIGPVYDEDSPNADANLWFANEVLPKLLELLPNHAYFDIAGLNRSAPLRDLQNGNIRLLGEVDNLKALTSRYKVFVAPTRFAAGIPLKVLSAARYGLPVVGTPLIASQLGWKNGEELLIGKTPEEFAEKCAELYSSPELWERIRENALEAVTRDYSEARFKNVLNSIFTVNNTSVPRHQLPFRTEG